MGFKEELQFSKYSVLLFAHLLHLLSHYLCLFNACLPPKGHALGLNLHGCIPTIYYNLEGIQQIRGQWLFEYMMNN